MGKTSKKKAAKKAPKKAPKKKTAKKAVKKKATKKKAAGKKKPPAPYAGKKAMTEKQRLFAEYYVAQGCLDATSAAKKAGYAGNANTLGVRAHILLKTPLVVAAIAELTQGDHDQAEQEMEANREFWRGVRDDVREKVGDRLKAAELLGRSFGQFLERTQQEGTLEVRVVRRDGAAGGIRKAEA